jgi:hypothetical protein
MLIYNPYRSWDSPPSVYKTNKKVFEKPLSVYFVIQDIVPIMATAYLVEAKRKFPIDNDAELLAGRYNHYLIVMLMLRVNYEITPTVLEQISNDLKNTFEVYAMM